MESRTPPQNLEAEQSVLGSILLDNEAYANLEGTLRSEHFYKEAHRKIFRALENLFRRDEPMDLVTVTEELRRSGDLETVGNVPYLIGLTDAVPTAAYAENYARIVVEKATLRELIGASGSIMQRAYDGGMPLEQILDAAEQSIFDLSSAKRSHSFLGMSELVGDTFTYIHELFENPDPVSGLRSGFKELDNMTAGLQDSSLNVLAARPSMGKTAFALTIAMNAALREGKTVGLFSLEMSGVQLVTRMLCSEARVDMSRVRNGQLTDRDFQRLADTAGRMSEAQIFIDDAADMTVMELRSRARRLMSEHGLGLIIIDYLQLMSGGGRFGMENRQQEISTISRGLKALARELDVPVLVLSQLSRAVESRPNKRPMLSDLRECVPGDTRVLLRDGRRVPIGELVGTRPCLLAVDPSGRLRPARAEAVWPVGRRALLELETASGRRLRASRDHRVLAEGGWRRLASLGPGDRIALARRIPPPSEPEAASEARVAALAGAALEGGLPAEAFRLDDAGVAALLRRLWPPRGADADRGEATPTYRAPDRAHADDVAFLLLRLGVVARIVAAPAADGGEACRVEVVEAGDRRRLREVLAPEGARTPAFAAPEAAADLRWDDVVAIRDAGAAEVFDLTVPGPASWLSEGLVSHNSGAIEQDADLVMFIYRDEYYDPQSEKQGIAEIIVGKQRNGPVGAVELQFHSAHVRFNDLAKQTH